MSEERREFFRVMARLPISAMAVDDQGGARLLRVESLDFSAGGMRLRSREQLDPGQRVRLSFQAGRPPEGMRVDARVVHCEPRLDGTGVYGLEFPELDLTREHRLVRAVFAQEQLNAGREERVRMAIDGAVVCIGPDGEEIAARATAISAAEICIVCGHPFELGEEVRVSLHGEALGLDLDAWAKVSESEMEGSGRRACTLVFEQLNRVTRAALLRLMMEAERRRLAER